MNDHASKAVLMRGPGYVAVEGPVSCEAASVGPRLSLKTTIRKVDACIPRDLHDLLVAGGADDGVIRSLSCALKAPEQGQDRYCVETLRLAIAVRLASLLSTPRTAGAAGELGPSGRQVRALQKWRLKRVVEYVDNHLADRISLLDLAVVAGLSRMHFASQFRVATGLRPHEFLLRRRIRRAEELLQNSTMPIVEIAVSVGFQTQAHFTTVFKRFVGCTPRHWRTANQLPSDPPARHFARSDIAAAI